MAGTVTPPLLPNIFVAHDADISKGSGPLQCVPQLGSGFLMVHIRFCSPGGIPGVRLCLSVQQVRGPARLYDAASAMGANPSAKWCLPATPLTRSSVQSCGPARRVLNLAFRRGGCGSGGVTRTVPNPAGDRAGGRVQLFSSVAVEPLSSLHGDTGGKSRQHPEGLWGCQGAVPSPSQCPVAPGKPKARPPPRQSCPRST